MSETFVDECLKAVFLCRRAKGHGGNCQYNESIFTQAELDAAVQAACTAAIAQQREACATAINKCYRQADGWARQSEVEAAIRNAPLVGVSARKKK